MGLLIGFARSFFGEAPATLRTFFRAVDISSVAFSTDHDETPTLQAGELARIALNFGADGSGTWRRKFDTNQYCVRPESRLTVRRSEEHTSELQSRENLVCRLLLETKNSRT